jgi:DNA-directed RNA polymerase specialized sigma24 family protein
MANPSPEVIMLVDEKGKDSQRILKMISECLHPGETELLELIQCEEIPAAEAERRRGMPAGTYRNLVKRIRRQFPKRPN